MWKFTLTAILALSAFSLFGQRTGAIYGTVKDKNTQEALIGANIILEGTELGASTDVDGNYRIENIPPGSYNLSCTYIGYEKSAKANIVVTSGNDNNITFELLEGSATELGEVVVSVNKSVQVRTAESPNSLQRLSAEEIKSNPGGNFDISRVIQALPGVGGTAGSVGGFRNDIIIRGGAPNENVFYLDGIEVPVINHFATQGSAGGPTGILNVSLIEDVQINTSSFNARHDNALSSVFQFKQKEGNPERLSGNVRLSGTEFATTLEGPLGSRNTTFLASARRSYLQFLFQAIDLPIRPNYWDFQYKVTHKINAKTTLTAIGIGAIDEFSFAVPRETTPDKEYVLRSQPSIEQWNYTVGFALKRLINNGFVNVTLSRNMFDNALDKFEDGRTGDESVRTLRVRSQEAENKLRVEVNKYVNKWKFSYGGMAQYVRFSNDLFNRLRKEIRDTSGNVIQPAVNVQATSNLDFFRFGFFGQVSRSFFNDRLSLSAGLRTDMNTFTDTGGNPLKTLSPRFSASYALAKKWNANASVGRYAKIPIYTVLGFRDENGAFVNKNNEYIISDHYVAGLEYLPTERSRVTLEGFYKVYSNYPVSVRDGISLANQGGDFGAIGNEAVLSTGEGRSYGLEFFFQQTLSKNLFAVFSYTLFQSEFSGTDGKFKPSAWDTRHLLSAQLGVKVKGNWEFGLKYRFQGGAPYTPFDLAASQRNYAALGVGLLDFGQLNTQRLGDFQQFDFRVDKKFNFKRWTLDLYVDITNALLFPSPAYPQYTFQRTADNSGFATTDGQALLPDGSNAIPLILDNNDVSVVPTFGFIIEF